MYILAIVQARWASSRLPAKVLANIEGEPMLVRVVERCKKARTVDDVIVATTTDPSDEAIAELCKQRGYRYFRGDPHDVLDRYYQAASQFGADVIVRVTGDCPVIDPGVIDDTVNAFLSTPEKAGRKKLEDGDEVVEQSSDSPFRFPFDFVANRLPPPWKRTYPMGLDTEVCTFHALIRAWKEASQDYEREHVMPYIYEQEGRFRICLLNHEPDYGFFRWAVDTPEDLEVVRRIYAHFGGRDDFSWLEVVSLYSQQPELASINASVSQKVFDEVDERNR